MKVKELQEQLASIDPEMDVYIEDVDSVIITLAGYVRVERDWPVPYVTISSSGLENE